MLVGLLQQGTNIAVLLEYNSKNNSTVKYILRRNYEGIPLRRLNSGRIQWTVCLTLQIAYSSGFYLYPFNNALQCIQFEW